MIVNKYQGNGGGGGYVLPTATDSRLGGVKIGSGISVDSGGTISAEGGAAQYDLDAMTQAERAEFVAMCENLTDEERRLLFVYRDGVICTFDHTEGSGNSFKIGFFDTRNDGWNYTTTKYRHFFVKADGSYEASGYAVFPEIVTFDTTYSDTAHTLSSSDGFSPLIPVSNLNNTSEGKVALNLRLLVGNNQTVLSSNAWVEKTGSWEGKIGAEWHYSGNVITAVWTVVENNATIASWTEAPEGGSAGGGDYVIVNALSAITTPREGMIAYIPSHTEVLSGYFISNIDGNLYGQVYVKHYNPREKSYMVYEQYGEGLISFNNGSAAYSFGADGTVKQLFRSGLALSYNDSGENKGFDILYKPGLFEVQIGVGQEYYTETSSSVTMPAETYIYKYGGWHLFEDGKISYYLNTITESEYDQMHLDIPKMGDGEVQFIVDEYNYGWSEHKFHTTSSVFSNDSFYGQTFECKASNGEQFDYINALTIRVGWSSGYKDWYFAKYNLLPSEP